MLIHANTFLILLVPSPSVSLELSSTDSNVTGNSITPEEYLAGSSLVISCNIVISLSVNTPFNVHTNWSLNGEPYINSPRVTTTSVKETSSSHHYQSQLVFTTLSSSMDTGNYTCSITVDSEDSLVYVSDAVPVNSTAAVLVQGMLLYRHNLYWDSDCVFVSTAPTIGEFSVSPQVVNGVEAGCPDSVLYENFTLVCSARKPALVIPQLEVTWLHGTVLEGNVLSMEGGAIMVNTLQFINGSVSHSGTYWCIARLLIPDSTEVNIMGSSTVTIKCKF